MAETVTEESGVGRSEDGILSSQSSQSGEALAEWRSSEQVENGSAVTSAPYWDTDDDDDGGPKPSELYGKYTWKIEKFSQITKRELRSSPFDVGGYKWYILIYPQGCDVCNHLSLFLCVANHDKLLPGWSHFAQFTIAVVNKDPKKSKYSDTLHRFWKKEHDWGWKKFMELSKIYEGFVEMDTLIIKAQVQVIREKADRPFRCLDSQYRRELVRVYLTNVEQICRRFVEERRGKLGKLIEDNPRWSSFRAFWSGIDQNSRRRMSKEHTDVILKVVVKHFFIEKEVTSTLVMDSLYSGLRALEGQSICRGRAKLLDVDEMPAPIVRVEKDTFVLVDDVLPLLERAAVEPLPPKDEKGPQNRTKDGNPGEDFNKDSIERDERRLTELGRRTVEIFVLTHIFSNKIEVAYQEAVALKRQEELIREEEAAWLAESEQKAKRGTNTKEKKTKKKQAKQKRNNRKGKDKERDERHNAAALQDNGSQQENLGEDKEVFMVEQEELLRLEKPDVLEDASDTSDVVESAGEALQVEDSEERDTSPVKWDITMSEAAHPPAESSSSEVCSLSPAHHNNGMAEKRRSPSVMDDSSSTCSTDSIPSVVTIGSYKGGNSISNNMKPGGSTTSSRGKSQKFKAATNEVSSWANQRESPSPPPASAVELTESSNVPGMSSSSKATDNESEADATSAPSQVRRVENLQGSREGEVALQQKRTSYKEQNSSGEVKLFKDKAAAAGQSSSSSSPPRSSSSSSIQQKTETKSSSASSTDPTNYLKKWSINGPQHTEKAAAAPLTNWSRAATSRSENQRGGGAVAMMPKHAERPPSPPSSQAAAAATPLMSRRSSAPLVPAIRPSAPAAISMAQSAPPLLARSASAVGRLGPEPSSSASSTPHSFVPQSYRNAIIGNSVASSSSPAPYTPHPASPSTSSSSSAAAAAAAAAAAVAGVKHSTQPYNSQPPTSLVSTAPAFLPSSSTERLDFGAVKPAGGFAFRDMISSGGGSSQWIGSCSSSGIMKSNNNQQSDHLLQTDMRSPSMDYYKQQQEPKNNLLLRDHHQFSSSDLQAVGTSGRQNAAAALLSDDFPHLDIINDLLDDEQQGMGKFVRTSNNSFQHPLNRHFSFPGGEVGVSGGGDLDASSSSAAAAATSCRFERTRSYRENGFQRSYNNNSFPSSSFESMRDYIPSQMSALTYANGQMDGGLIPSQWHHHHVPSGAGTARSDLSTILGGGMKNHHQHQHHLETDAYPPYYSPEYTTNMACGLNGYNVFRPPNGH